MDPWTGPTPTTDQFPRRAEAGDGIRQIIDKIGDVSRQVREAASNLLSTAGITVSKLGMAISSSLTVDGDLTTTGTTHIGGATDIDGTLNVDANATFGGAVAITGTLSLPAGIIDNDALANPIVPDRFNTRTSGWALAAGGEVKASVTLTTPAGFTKALVATTATASIANSSGSTVVFTVQPIVAGTGGEASHDLVAAGYIGKDSAPTSELVTGLTGGATFTVQTSLATGGVAITASASNVAVINGTVLWMRS